MFPHCIVLYDGIYMVLYTDVVSVERTRTRVQALHATRARRETGESRAARARAARGVFTAEPKRSARHGSVSGKNGSRPFPSRRARHDGRVAGVTAAVRVSHPKREKKRNEPEPRARNRETSSLGETADASR